MRVSYAGQILFCAFGTNAALQPPSQLRRGAHEIISATVSYTPFITKTRKAKPLCIAAAAGRASGEHNAGLHDIPANSQIFENLRLNLRICEGCSAARGAAPKQ